MVQTRRLGDRTNPKSLYNPSNPRAGIDLQGVLISIVAVVVLAFIERKIDFPKKFGVGAHSYR